MDLESGLDWADGLDGRNGTPTPDALITFKSSRKDGGGQYGDTQPIEELLDSPEIELAEQGTITHRFTMDWPTGINLLPLYGRGTILTDSFDNITRVLSTKLQRQGGKGALMTITAESLSFDTPPDEFSIVPVELGINIIKYPRYFYAFLGDGQGSTTELLNQQVIRQLQNYFENPTAAYRDALTTMLLHSISNPVGSNSLQGTVDAAGAVIPAANIDLNSLDPINYPNSTMFSPLTGTDTAKAAAVEIIQKYWRNEETPYIIGYQITWSSFYYLPQYLNPGGYVEDPITEASPQLPDYFYSPGRSINTPPPSSGNETPNPPDISTIFDQLSTFNPQCYALNGDTGGQVVLSWLRKADQQEFQRTWTKVDRTWIGSPVGFWDAQLYNSNNRPSDALPPTDAEDTTHYLVGSIPSANADVVAAITALLKLVLIP